MPTPKLHFSREEFNARIAKTRTAMQNRGLDLLMVSDPSNMNWLTGYDGWSFYVHQCVVLTLTGEPIWFGRGQDGNGALRTCFMKPSNIIGYPDHYVQSTERHPMDYLSAQLTDRGLGKGVIGVEMDNYWFSAAAFASLQSHLPNAKFTDATALVNWQRAIKSDAELTLMRQAGKIVGRMHERIVEKVEPVCANAIWWPKSMTPPCAMIRPSAQAADYPALVPLLPSGADASAPHLTWDDAPMKSGEGTFLKSPASSNAITAPCRERYFWASQRKPSLTPKRPFWKGWRPGWKWPASAIPAKILRWPSSMC